MLSAGQVISESRRNLRIRENIPIRWKIKDSEMSGEGRVLNISASGMLLESRSGFSPLERCVFGFEALMQGKASFLPQEGRLIWSRKKGSKKMLCGIEFVDPATEVIAELRDRVQRGIARLAGFRQLRTVIGGILFVVMMTLGGFVVKQHNENYLNIQRSYQLLSQNYQGQSTLTQTYRAQLQSTKIMLAEAESILASVESEKAQLQALVQASNQDNASLNQMIASVNAKNSQLSQEVASLKGRLALLEDDIQSLQEGSSRIALFKSKIRNVKIRMSELKREAYYARVAAQAEKDRVGMLIGNNGYFMKDGKAYHPNGKDPEAAKNVKIDVRFVK